MNKRLKKLLAFLLVFTPFLEPYRIGGVTLDTMALFISLLMAFIFLKKYLQTDYGAKQFFYYALIVPNIVAVAYGYYIHITSSLIVLLLYILCYYKIFPNVQLQYLKKYYRYLVILVCVVFVFQEVMFQSVGYRFSALLPFLDVRYEGIPMSTFILNQMYYPRSSTFFLEPSHMAHFLLPYLALSLGENSSGLSLKRYIEPAIITIVLIYLRSGCGIVGLSFVWLFFMLQINLSGIKKVVFFIVCLTVAVYAINYILSTEIGNSLMNRSTELQGGGDYDRSGTIRIFRGFYVYWAMDLLQQIFGVGTGGSIDVIENSPYFIMFFGSERYLNNLQMLLIGFGLIGTLLFFVHYYKLYRGNNLSGKLTLIAFLSLCFLESFFLTSKMILFFVIAFLCKKEKTNKKILL